MPGRTCQWWSHERETTFGWTLPKLLILAHSHDKRTSATYKQNLRVIWRKSKESTSERQENLCFLFRVVIILASVVMFIPCVGDNCVASQEYPLCPIIFVKLCLRLLHLCDQTFDQLHGILYTSSNLLSLLFIWWHENRRPYSNNCIMSITKNLFLFTFSDKYGKYNRKKNVLQHMSLCKTVTRLKRHSKTFDCAPQTILETPNFGGRRRPSMCLRCCIIRNVVTRNRLNK